MIGQREIYLKSVTGEYSRDGVNQAIIKSKWTGIHIQNIVNNR